MSLLSCFAGLLGSEKPKAKAREPISPSWATLPVPVSNETLANWLPVSLVQEQRTVLFFHLGRFDLLSLELSGCTRRDLLLICEEKLAELEQQASAISVVVDLHHVRLEQLNSHWWKLLAPRLLQLVEQRFPGLLAELIFLRANRLTSLAAQRLGARCRNLVVLAGDEVAAQEFLEGRGMAFVADCFFRDPQLGALQKAHRRRHEVRRRKRCCRWSLVVLVVWLVLLLLESWGVPTLSGVSWDWAALRPWSSSGLVLLVASLWLWPFHFEEAIEDAQLRALLLGSPICWAAAYAGHLPMLLSVLAPGLVVLGALLLVPRAPARRLQDGAKTWWPALNTGPHGEPRFETPVVSRRSLPKVRGDGRQLLGRLQQLSAACRQVRLGTKRSVGDMVIQCIVAEEDRFVWSASVRDDPVMFLASEVILRTAQPLEGILWALYSPEERMKWDSASFKVYEVLGGPEAQSSSRSSCDFIYLRLPGIPGVKDRDMVQERFFMKLDEPGYCLAIQSCTAEQCSGLELPSQNGVVRATTILSGYILRPDAGGVRLTAVSQMDLGGSVPQWVQGMVKKAGKRMPLQWAQRLEDYCNSHASNGAT